MPDAFSTIMTRSVYNPECVQHSELTQWFDGRSFEDCKAQYDLDGYIIFENVLTPNDVKRAREAITPHFTRTGRNNFEGFNSNRVYSLLKKSPAVFSDMITHPLALAFVEAELGRSALISSLLAINLHPGETVQDWHCLLYTSPSPRDATLSRMPSSA